MNIALWMNERAILMSVKTSVTSEQIERVLDGIRPALRANGNEVEVKDIEENDVRIVLSGDFTCGYGSMIMLKFGIERTMREHISGFGEVILEMPG